MDDYNQLLLHVNGKAYKFAFPDLGQISPIAFNMRPRVQEYIRELALPESIEYIVDVGACVGTFAVPFAMIWPNAEILCIKPSRYNYPFLSFNTRPFPQISTVKLAAHNKRTTALIAAPSKLQRPSMDDDPRTGLISMYGEGTRHRETVAAERLDDIVEKKVDWLKIDVEGNERNVLKGAKKILARDRPILQIEVKNENQEMAHTTINVLLWEILQYNYQYFGAIRNDMLFKPGQSLWK